MNYDEMLKCIEQIKNDVCDKLNESNPYSRNLDKAYSMLQKAHTALLIAKIVNRA